MTNCPWDGFESAAIHFCERELCAWIEQPINTWSNLGYILMGIYLIRLALRENRRPLVAIGVIEILVGLGSFLFHASSTHFGEVIDVGAMYLLSCYALVWNLKRYLKKRDVELPNRSAVLLYSVLTVGSTVVVAVFRGAVGVWLFAIQLVLAGHFETTLARKFRDDISYRPLVALLITFGIAWSCWWLDVLKIVCNPDNHYFQGHAVWHVLNAFCFYFLYRFYAQIQPNSRTDLPDN